jgi:membrane carboxypeptidase/penicillin-binding protein PbpC
MMGAFTQLEDKSEGWWQRHNWINNWTSHTRVVVWDSDDELIMFNTNDQSYAMFTNLDRISPEATSALILQEF